MKHIIKNVTKLVEYGLLTAIVMAFFVVVSPLLPTKKFIATYAVVSGSMEPTVPVGALAFVNQVEPPALKQNDIIAFPEPDNPSRTILHRITQIDSVGTITNLKTRGDNNPVGDAWVVSPAKVKGRMIFSLPWIGYPIIYAQKPSGFVLLIGIPAALLVVLQLRSIFQGIEEEVQKRTSQALKNHVATIPESEA